MSFRRPTAKHIATPAGLLEVLVGLYEKIDKPGGGNLTQFIKTVINDTITGGGGGGTLASFPSSELVQVMPAAGEFFAPGFTFPLPGASIPKSTLTFAALLYTASAGGTAQFRLRAGGALIGASAQASSSFQPQEITGTIANPGHTEIVLTIQAGTGAAKVRGLYVAVS